MQEENKYKFEDYQHFCYRFQRAEELPNEKKGIILIGNTRAGKSTIGCGLAGAQLQTIHDHKQNLTYINPIGKNFEDKVKHCNQSVTEKPNFFLVKQPKGAYAIVDMPGHADNSEFRQLINYHYIKTMASKLQEVYFLMVINIQVKNSNYSLPKTEIKMMESFIKMFPNFKDHLSLIVNRVQNVSHEQKIKEAILDAIKSQGLKNKQFYKYSTVTPNKIFLIQRPSFNQKCTQPIQYNLPNSILSIPTNSKTYFMKIDKLDYCCFDIVNRNSNNSNIKYLIENLVQPLSQKFTKGMQVFLFLFNLELEDSKNHQQFKTIIESFLEKYRVDQAPRERLQEYAEKNKNLKSNQNHLNESNLLKLIHDIYSYNNTFHEKYSQLNNKQKLLHAEPIVDSYIQRLNDIISRKKNKNINSLLLSYRYEMHRVFTQIKFFILTVQNFEFLSQSHQLRNGKHRSYSTFNELFDAIYTKLWDFKNSLNTQKLISNFKEYVQINLNNITITSQIVKEISQNFRMIEKMIQSQQDLMGQFKKDMSRKQNWLRYKQILGIHEAGGTKPEELIIKILQAFTQTSDYYSLKLQALLKLAYYLQKSQEWKLSIACYLYLHLNDEVMRLIDKLDQKKGGSEQNLIQIGQQFLEKGKFNYAEKCFERAKLIVIGDFGKFIDLQRRLYDIQQKRGQIIKGMKQKASKALQQEYWQWETKINPFIMALKVKYKVASKEEEKLSLLTKSSLFPKSSSKY